MKIDGALVRNFKTLANGKLSITVEIDPAKALLVVDPDRFYKLGYPHDDIVGGHIIAGARPTYWCSLEQKWKDD